MIFAFDLDGTLLNSHGKIAPKQRQIIQELLAKGHHIVIASGRTTVEIRSIVAELKLEQSDRAYFIAYNGVITVKASSGEIVASQCITDEDVRAIAAFLEPKKLKMHVFAEKRVYLSHDIEQTIGMDYHDDTSITRCEMKNFFTGKPVYKVLVYADSLVLDLLKAELPKDMTDYFQIFKSASVLIEFVHKLGSKGDALKRLAEYLEVDRSNVVAFGDEENDLSMIAYAGYGIAMGNAKPVIKAAARHITLSNDNDGINEAIRHYIHIEE